MSGEELIETLCRPGHQDTRLSDKAEQRWGLEYGEYNRGSIDSFRQSYEHKKETGMGLG